MNFLEIYEGWKNHLFPTEKLKEIIDTTSQSRLDICIQCPENSTPSKIKMYSTCTICKCPLIQKSKSLKSKCPIDKWGPVATEKQEHEIKLAIKDGEKNSS